MIKMISVKEAARQWNITERRVAELCRSGRIEGTVRQGRSWQIPADASKPADKRIRSGSYRKIRDHPACLCQSVCQISGWHRRNITMLIRRC